jgi:hypothetical protein
MTATTRICTNISLDYQISRLFVRTTFGLPRIMP